MNDYEPNPTIALDLVRRFLALPSWSMKSTAWFGRRGEYCAVRVMAPRRGS